MLYLRTKSLNKKSSLTRAVIPTGIQKKLGFQPGIIKGHRFCFVINRLLNGDHDARLGS